MRILFLCTGNSCRSQMAEGHARRRASADVEVYSAGTRPVGIHPLAGQVMAEAGVSLVDHDSKDLRAVPATFDLVVTLCGDAAETCPSFPGAEVVHWPIDDPARATGESDAVLAVFRRVRDELADRVTRLFDSHPALRGRG